jgi:hypothetical protein
MALEPLEGLQQEKQSTRNRFVRIKRKRFQTITNCFAGFQAQSLNVPVDFPLLQRIALPVTPWNPRKRPSRNIRWSSSKTSSTKRSGARRRKLNDKQNHLALSHRRETRWRGQACGHFLHFFFLGGGTIRLKVPRYLLLEAKIS